MRRQNSQSQTLFEYHATLYSNTNKNRNRFLLALDVSLSVNQTNSCEYDSYEKPTSLASHHGRNTTRSKVKASHDKETPSAKYTKRLTLGSDSAPAMPLCAMKRILPCRVEVIARVILWFGPNRHNDPRPRNPVRPIGFLKMQLSVTHLQLQERRLSYMGAP